MKWTLTTLPPRVVPHSATATGAKRTSRVRASRRTRAPCADRTKWSKRLSYLRGSVSDPAHQPERPARAHPGETDAEPPPEPARIRERLRHAHRTGGHHHGELVLERGVRQRQVQRADRVRI